MTRRDVRIIAETIRNAPISEDAKQTVASAFANALERTMLSRLNFNRETFVNSCMDDGLSEAERNMRIWRSQLGS